MKVLVQRYGLVLKTIDIKGDRAKIGNAADCEVMIDDPYLSAHIADIVKKDGEWRIIDTGTSLEGVTRSGVRVEDEPLLSKEPYQVGGFEFLIEDDSVPRRTAERANPGASPTSAGRRDIPQTIIETDSAPVIPRTVFEEPVIPKTVFEMPMPSKPASQPGMTPTPQPLQMTPMPEVAPAHAAAPAAPAPNRRRLLMIVLAAGIMLMLLIIVVGGGSKKKPKGKEDVATSTTTTTTAATTETAAPVATAVVSGDDLIKKLDIDGALNAWERQLKEKPDPAVADRFCRVAADTAAVYAASGDAAKAKSYYARVVAVGAADSEVVKMAKTKLGT